MAWKWYCCTVRGLGHGYQRLIDSNVQHIMERLLGTRFGSPFIYSTPKINYLWKHSFKFFWSDLWLLPFWNSRCFAFQVHLSVGAPVRNTNNIGVTGLLATVKRMTLNVHNYLSCSVCTNIVIDDHLISWYRVWCRDFIRLNLNKEVKIRNQGTHWVL